MPCELGSSRSCSLCRCVNLCCVCCLLLLQFVEKDPKLAEPVLLQLLKFWPVTNSQKEVLFLGELEEILELTQPLEFQRVLVPLFKQLARCLTSAHFQVIHQSRLAALHRHMHMFVPGNIKWVIR